MHTACGCVLQQLAWAETMLTLRQADAPWQLARKQVAHVRLTALAVALLCCAAVGAIGAVGAERPTCAQAQQDIATWLNNPPTPVPLVGLLLWLNHTALQDNSSPAEALTAHTASGHATAPRQGCVVGAVLGYALQANACTSHGHDLAMWELCCCLQDGAGVYLHVYNPTWAEGCIPLTLVVPQHRAGQHKVPARP